MNYYHYHNIHNAAFITANISEINATRLVDNEFGTAQEQFNWKIDNPTATYSETVKMSYDLTTDLETARNVKYGELYSFSFNQTDTVEAFPHSINRRVNNESYNYLQNMVILNNVKSDLGTINEMFDTIPVESVDTQNLIDVLEVE